MSYSEELLLHAFHLAGEKWDRVQNVSSRRAVSAAYYALFHQLIGDAAHLLAPNVPAATNYRIQRWFAHGEMRRICQYFLPSKLSQPLLELVGESASPNLQFIARSFIQLQDARHKADYDLSFEFREREVSQYIEQAFEAIEAWKRIANTAEANIFIPPSSSGRTGKGTAPRSYMKNLSLALVVGLLCVPSTRAQSDLPHLETRNSRHALVVDGKPFLLLGAQINNSSSWPATLPAAWSALEAMHVNTAEAPVYWEQIEPTRGTFDFANVDLLVTQAREHHLRLVLLWFGTWKNGQNHYVPEWIKSDPKTYPREITAYGKLLDVMSPSSPANLAADKAAFAALMHHLKSIDGAQHTVIMIQVENESGSVGSVRDFSPAAQKLFDAEVPAGLARTLHLRPGTWSRTFGADADESFEAYSTAHYINEVAAAGKAEYPLLMYCNVWFAYPVHALENRDRPSPGQEYPSGGAQQANIPIWKAAAPAIDILAPDFYSEDRSLFRTIAATYARPDNPLLIPETRTDANFGPNFFYALGSGAIGFAPFGIDRSPQAIQPTDQITASPATPAIPAQRPPNAGDNFTLFQSPNSVIAQLNLDGKLQTAVEERGAARQTIHFPTAEATVSFGFPQSDGAQPPGTPTLQGRALVAQLGPLDFLVTGFDASVSFTLPPSELRKPAPQQLEILRAEEGEYIEGVWHTIRILNGDQTDRGLNFRGSTPPLVRIHLHTLPLYDEAIHRARPTP